MPGRTRKLADAGRPPPYQLWVLTVAPGHRLRPSKDVALVAPWLNAEPGPIHCACILGAAGGVILAPSKDSEAGRRAFDAAMLGAVSIPPDTGRPWHAIARYFATTWQIPISVEKSRFSMTLPEEPRKLGLLPETGQVAVMFAVNRILEVWRADRWCDHVRQTANSLDELKHAALEGLASSREEA